jgi:hypothetical protein
MESFRNNVSGEVTVKTARFVVVVSEQGLAVKVDGAVVHEWKPRAEHKDEPSPRSRPAARKRGGR